jgi:hypothetical protein
VAVKIHSERTDYVALEISRDLVMYPAERLPPGELSYDLLHNVSRAISVVINCRMRHVHSGASG